MSPRRRHPVGVFAVLAIATVLGAIAIGAIWAKDQLLDTGSWVSTSDRMLGSPGIRHRVADFLAEELVAGVRDQVSEGGGELSGAEEARLESGVPRLVERGLASRPIEVVWRRANRTAHESLLRILDEDEPASGDPVVVLDLDPALRHLARELKFGELQASPPPPGTGRIEVVRESQLETAQTAVGVIRDVPLPAVVVLLGLYALALLGASTRRRGFAAIGLSLAAAGVLALLARAIAGGQIVDALVAERSVRPAANDAWGIATSTLSSLATMAIVLGALLVLVAWLAAPILDAWRQREAQSG